LTKCIKCHNSFREEWKILQNKSELEKQDFLKYYRTSPCPHFNSTKPHISKKLSFDNNLPKPEIVDLPKPEIIDLPKPEIIDLPKPEIIDLPKPEIIDLPKPEIDVSEHLKSNSVTGLPDDMNSKDYHDFILGR
jgi:hypothetical protein